MPYGVTLCVWGPYALFTRPEMKAERVSYDIITPSAARGILEAIYWKPEIHWVIDRLHILHPIRFDNIRRNEIESTIPKGTVKRAMKDGETPLFIYIEENRQQRAAMVLTNVKYLIDAHFEIIGKTDDHPGKHLDIFNRRVRKGQCFHRPYLGCREFPAFFKPGEEEPAPSFFKDDPEKDLGWMLHDIDFTNENTPYFFRATMCHGVIDVPLPQKREVQR